MKRLFFSALSLYFSLRNQIKDALTKPANFQEALQKRTYVRLWYRTKEGYEVEKIATLKLIPAQNQSSGNSSRKKPQNVISYFSLADNEWRYAKPEGVLDFEPISKKQAKKLMAMA